METRGVLLTTSFDCSVRVWNVKGAGDIGEYVGSFGAAMGWSLTNTFPLYKAPRKSGLSPSPSPSPEPDGKPKLVRRDTFKASAFVSEEFDEAARHAEEDKNRAQSVSPSPSKSGSRPPSTLDAISEDDKSVSPTTTSESSVSKAPKISVTHVTNEGEQVESSDAIPEDEGHDDSDEDDDNFAAMMEAEVEKEKAEENETNKRASRVTQSAKMRRAKEWNRVGALGGMYSAGMVERHNHRMVQQKEAGKQPTAADATVPRLPNICAPFSALSLRHAQLDPVNPVRVPSAVVRSRRATALDALDGDSSTRSSWTRGKNPKKVRSSRLGTSGPDADRSISPDKKISPQKPRLPAIPGPTA